MTVEQANVELAAKKDEILNATTALQLSHFYTYDYKNQIKTLLQIFLIFVE